MSSVWRLFLVDNLEFYPQLKQSSYLFSGKEQVFDRFYQSYPQVFFFWIMDKEKAITQIIALL